MKWIFEEYSVGIIGLDLLYNFLQFTRISGKSTDSNGIHINLSFLLMEKVWKLIYDLCSFIRKMMSKFQDFWLNVTQPNQLHHYRGRWCNFELWCYIDILFFRIFLNETMPYNSFIQFHNYFVFLNYIRLKPNFLDK